LIGQRCIFVKKSSSPAVSTFSPRLLVNKCDNRRPCDESVGEGERRRKEQEEAVR
jgi:hypothetical protein